MRYMLAGASVLLALSAIAQAGWMPLSREVERPYAAAAGALGSSVHTAIRPYRVSELRALDPKDSLRPIALLGALDRWSGARNGRTFRWGPLLDASAVLNIDSNFTAGYRTSAGLWMEKDLGSKLTLHVNGQAWGEQLPAYLDTLARATQMSAGEGYADRNGAVVTHYDVQGYLSWDPGKYFNFMLGRGKNFFGEGYRSLFLSDEATSYPYLKITTSVWKVKYVNLFTAMNDIRGAGGDASRFQRKYTSMHYLSINAHKRINLSLFESIVWSQGDSLYPRGFDVNYLNPIIFYRPTEYSIGSPDNALLGFAINFKLGRRTLFYSQVMLDEFLLKEVRAGRGWYANKQAIQLGLVSRNVFKVQGLLLRAEWNAVRPFMYTHSDTRQNYAHMGQPLAHPYGSNFQEALVQAEWSPKRLLIGLRASMAWLGSDSTYSYGNNIFRPERDRPVQASGAPRDYNYRFGMSQEYTLFQGELRAGWLVDPATGTRIEASWMLRMRTVEGEAAQMSQVVRIGLNCYFRDRHAEQEVRYVLN